MNETQQPDSVDQTSIDPQERNAVDDGPQQPLPDLTRGIPSTLEAELREAQRSHTKSDKASVNITEDPSEKLPGDDEGGPRRPKVEYVSSSDRKKNTAFKYTYLFLGAGIVGYAIYLGRNWETEELSEKHAEDAPDGWSIGKMFTRVKARAESTRSYYNDPVFPKLLPDEDKNPEMRLPFTLVISLEDMLVHQEWDRVHGWRIAKRPGVDYFLRYLQQYFEIVLFTSQPSAIADQVLRKLDPYMTIRWPLFREATLYKDGVYIKVILAASSALGVTNELQDLSYLNRDLKKVVIMDTNPDHVRHQPENAIILPKWKGDPSDQTLVQMIPFLEYLACMGFEDARTVLKSFEGKYIPAEFARREKLMREKFEAERKNKPKPKKSFGFGAIMGKQQSPDSLGNTDEALAEGKMIWDIIRERGQRMYEEVDKNIREEGPKWLAAREAEEKAMQEEAMKNMKAGGFLGGWFGSKKAEEEKKE